MHRHPQKKSSGNAPHDAHKNRCRLSAMASTFAQVLPNAMAQGDDWVLRLALDAIPRHFGSHEWLENC